MMQFTYAQKRRLGSVLSEHVQAVYVSVTMHHSHEMAEHASADGYRGEAGTFPVTKVGWCQAMGVMAKCLYMCQWPTHWPLGSVNVEAIWFKCIDRKVRLGKGKGLNSDKEFNMEIEGERKAKTDGTRRWGLRAPWLRITDLDRGLREINSQIKPRYPESWNYL